MTFEDVIRLFLNGEEKGQSTLGNKPGHLKIVENRLIHYDTTVAERTEDGFVLNRTKYSIQTGKLVNRLAELISSYSVALMVPKDYDGSLIPYIKQ